jgi:asparagine synthetase B (glutamine-hydrolysing)
MCRIVGFIDFNFNNSYSLEETITLMRDNLIHGGPDDEGFQSLHLKMYLMRQITYLKKIEKK